MSRDEQQALRRFERIAMWKRGDRRAAHKPLLLLLALARVQRGESRLMSFQRDVERKLVELLDEFGPPRQVQHPNFPFWRLQNDGLWDIPERIAILEGDSVNRSGDVPVSVLRGHDAHGGLPEDLDAALRADPQLVQRIAGMLLDDNFAPSLHDAILDAVGMPWVVVDTRRRKRRDPGFRDAILRIYEYRCAVCGYAGRLGMRLLNLEAAHVRWHAHDGPDELDNGVAMCSFHHRAFDRGAIGLDRERRILVSQEVHGGELTEHWLLRWSGKPLASPQLGQPGPAPAYIDWHRSEVFRDPARA
jgi:putative restriction endonuclease